jgi:hypothetical protein
MPAAVASSPAPVVEWPTILKYLSPKNRLKYSRVTSSWGLEAINIVLSSENVPAVVVDPQKWMKMHFYQRRHQPCVITIPPQVKYAVSSMISGGDRRLSRLTQLIIPERSVVMFEGGPDAFGHLLAFKCHHVCLIEWSGSDLGYRAVTTWTRLVDAYTSQLVRIGRKSNINCIIQNVVIPTTSSGGENWFTSPCADMKRISPVPSPLYDARQIRTLKLCGQAPALHINHMEPLGQYVNLRILILSPNVITSPAEGKALLCSLPPQLSSLAIHFTCLPIILECPALKSLYWKHRSVNPAHKCIFDFSGISKTLKYCTLDTNQNSPTILPHSKFPVSMFPKLKQYTIIQPSTTL